MPDSSPSTATTDERALPPPGDPAVEGGFYLASHAVATLREQGRAIIDQAWLDEAGGHGPLPRAGRDYWHHLTTSRSTGRNAAMALIDNVMEVDTSGAAQLAEASRSDPWTSDAAGLATDTGASTDDDLLPDAGNVEVVVYCAGLEPASCWEEERWEGP